MIIQLLNH